MERMSVSNGKLIFSEISPEQTAGLWPHLSQGIDETYRRWQKHVEWVPNDFFDSIRKDRAKVAFMYDDGKRIGFLIYRLFYEEFTNKKYLHIWLAYIYPEFRHRIRIYLPQWSDFFDKMVRFHGCRFMEMDSLRNGWTKMLDKFNMKLRRLVYRKEF